MTTITCADIINQMHPGYALELVIFGGEIKFAAETLATRMSIRPCKALLARENVLHAIEEAMKPVYVIGISERITEIGGVPLIVDDTTPNGQIVGVSEVRVYRWISISNKYYATKLLPTVVVEGIPVEET